MDDNVSIDDEKEKLIGALHNKNALPSLRTYQGDVASFIKSKDQSIVDIAIKNRKVEEERQKRDKDIIERVKVKDEKAPNDANFDIVQEKSSGTGFLMIVLGIMLVCGSLFAISYTVFVYIKKIPVSISSSGQDSLITNSNPLIVDVTSGFIDSVEKALVSAKSNPKSKIGVTSIEVSNGDNKTKVAASDFINKMGWGIPEPLIRSLADEFMLGVYTDISANNDWFLILKVEDYGIAFRDMLVWESTMFDDLKPVLNANPISISTDGGDFKFKDLIIKNKDTRVLFDDSKNIILIYTFLNQDTLLITESENSVSNILNDFINSSIVR